MPGHAEPEWAPSTTLTVLLGSAPLRVALLVFLTQHPDGAKVAELSAALDAPQPTIRGHLKSLMETGVVSNDADPYFSPMGQRARYFVNKPKLVDEIRTLVNQFGLVLIDPQGPAQSIPGNTAVTVTLNDLRTLLRE